MSNKTQDILTQWPDPHLTHGEKLSTKLIALHQYLTKYRLIPFEYRVSILEWVERVHFLEQDNAALKAECSEYALREAERQEYEAGLAEDPDMYGGILG